MISKYFKRKPIDTLPLIFFVHIPKTAGTSFRTGLESIYKVVCDYNQKSDKTSEIVLDHIYSRKDFFSFDQELSNQKYSCISGHIGIIKYQTLLDPRCIVSFMREPISRQYSSYKHYVKHLEYKSDFKTFMNEKRFINTQEKFLRGMPIELIGALGITEKYSESLLLINDALNVDIPYIEKNTNKTIETIGDIVDKKTLQELRLLNRKDISLYKKAKWLHEQRILNQSAKFSWVHGIAKLTARNVLTGLAWFADSDNLVELDIYVNDVLHTTVFAKEFYSGPIKTIFPRKGYVKFSYTFTKDVVPNSQINVRVKTSNQLINFKPLLIT